MSDSGGFDVSFASLGGTERPGLQVTDPIERHQFTLFTATAIRPKPADTDTFWFPVDAAVQIRTDEITLSSVVAAYVRDGDGEMLAEAEHFAFEEFPAGTYSLELCAPIKLYLRVEGPLTVTSDAERTRIEFDGERTVLVGARSHHKQPAATVETTEDPRDIMDAISTFGSALKTTSPERSYPTLRGHPPLVELDESLSIPDGLEVPDTGVRLELPPDYRSIYVATPLAYYFAADVTPGSSPRLVTDRGFEHRLDGPQGFETEVEQVLKQSFFLDCVTRTEGYYRVDLHERETIENAIDIDFADLYHRPLAEQLETYLEVPFTDIKSAVPEWKLTSHIAPTPENVELLPFVTNDLAVVRTPDATPVESSEVQAEVAGEFFRDDSFTRSAAADGGADSRSYVQPSATDSLEQAWIGDGAPIGASKATSTAYHNRLARSPVEGDIGITVVCNDPKMVEEMDVVDETYGSREDLAFDVTLHNSLTRAELRSVLTAGGDFLHYIGHIDGEGFECVDGKLDATTLESVGMDAFLLNACQSYDQGSALIEAGAIAGIVTLSDVVNSGAVRMGKMLGRLLNNGFALGNALDVARDDSVVGQQYTLIGDGGLSLARTDGGPPNVCRLESTDQGYELDWQTYPTTRLGMGSLVMPIVKENDRYYLSSGESATFDMSREDVREFLELETVPVRIDGELRWSDEIDFESL